jgi:hypothetical protein
MSLDARSRAFDTRATASAQGLLTSYLSKFFGHQVTVTFNDPPAALAGLFIALGLREMYVVYIRNSKMKKAVPSHQEVWETEKVESVA